MSYGSHHMLSILIFLKHVQYKGFFSADAVECGSSIASGVVLANDLTSMTQSVPNGTSGARNTTPVFSGTPSSNEAYVYSRPSVASTSASPSTGTPDTACHPSRKRKTPMQSGNGRLEENSTPGSIPSPSSSVSTVPCSIPNSATSSDVSSLAPLSKSLSYPSANSPTHTPASVVEQKPVHSGNHPSSLKRVKPRPLNLSATAALSNTSTDGSSLLVPSPYFMHGPPSGGGNYSAAAAATSPLVTQFSQLYAAASLSASAGLMCPTSPFTSFLTTAVSPMLAGLSSPMAAAAAAASASKITPTAGTAAPSSSTSAMQQPIFQFPPNPSHMAAMATAAMMSPLMAPFINAAMMNGNNCPATYGRGNFVSRSPESLKTPVPERFLS